MIIQHIDGTLVEESDQPSHPGSVKQVFYTEIPHHLLNGIDGWIERLIGFAFDDLDAHHVELRVVDPDRD